MNRYKSKNFYVDENGFRAYSDNKYKSVPGIDVSVFQGDIDWNQVKASGVQFVMIRMGYRGSGQGTLQEDENFRQNIRGARRAGLDVGVYFYSQAITTDEAVEEAKYVIRAIRGKGVKYPVVFDLEHTEGDRIGHLTKMERTEITDAFCTIVQKNGHTPMIYGNPSWLLKHLDLQYLTNYDLWLAHYNTGTYFPYAYRMWQYSDGGTVDGIDGSVDLNLWIQEK